MAFPTFRVQPSKLSKSQKKKLRKQELTNNAETERRCKDHKTWLSDVSKQVEELTVDESECEHSFGDRYGHWTKAEEESSESVERCNIIEEFEEGECNVWSKEFIHDTARTEIEYQRRGVLKIKIDDTRNAEAIEDSTKRCVGQSSTLTTLRNTPQFQGRGNQGQRKNALL